MNRHLPTPEEVADFLGKDRNWGRWGADDQQGAMNLITNETRVAAARLVRSGRSVSLSREFPKTPAPNNPNPAQHFMRRLVRGGGGGAVDYYGISYHGVASTHLDALCHVWDSNGMWNGRDADEVIGFDRAHWGSIEHWKDGIITRGVFLDVPKFRGEPFITMDRPIHGWELEDVLKAEGVQLHSGGALIVYGGREKWNEANPTWGSQPERPGLHASCLKFIRESDCSMLVWDMMDFQPSGYGIPWSVSRCDLRVWDRASGQRAPATAC